MPVKRRTRAGLAPASMRFIERANAVLDGLRDYWPLTLRQLYYQLVAAGDIDNSIREYKRLSRLLSDARYAGLVSWDAIEDRSRTLLPACVWRDKYNFIKDELDGFLAGYRRDPLQSQPERLEVWIEKDALRGVVKRAAHPYAVPVVAGRGFSSTSFLHQFRQRILASADNGQSTHVLYFGDLDPSGYEMLPAMLRKLQGELGLGDQVDGTRCALNVDQVEHYQLTHKPDALKRSDPRARKYREQFGNLAVELDALPPADLAHLVERAIVDHLEADTYNNEVDTGRAERTALAAIREKVIVQVNVELQRHRRQY